MEIERAASTKPLEPGLAGLDFQPGCTWAADPCQAPAAGTLTLVCELGTEHRVVVLLCPGHAHRMQAEISQVRSRGPLLCPRCFAAGRTTERLVNWAHL